VDFGKAAMRDPRTHDVYMDKDGNMVNLEGVDLAMQDVEVCLSTIRGEEKFDINFGLDLYYILANPGNLTAYYLLTSQVTQCLTKEEVPELQDAYVLDVKENKDDPEEVYYLLSIGIVTLNNDQATEKIKLGV
jgi:hypothetical protein